MQCHLEDPKTVEAVVLETASKAFEFKQSVARRHTHHH